jgi:DNA-binding SARP family transcriptional activator/predicted ATPase
MILFPYNDPYFLSLSLPTYRLFSVSIHVSKCDKNGYNYLMPHLAIFALGPLRIELDGQPISTSRHKALALLVYLVLNPEKQSREVLSAFLWPDYEQEKAFAYLRRTLWELHSLLGEGWLEADREQIGLIPQVNVIIDVSEFQAHLAALRHHNHPTSTVFCHACLAHLRTATLLYRGDFLAGFSLRDSPGFEDWQFFQAEELRQAYSTILQRLSTLLYQQGSLTDGTMFAQRWLALDNYNEEAHRLMMKLYNRSGQRHLALRQFQECQRVLQMELGVSPETATQTLYESISSGEVLQEQDLISDQFENLDEKPTGTDVTVSLLEGSFFTRETIPASILPTSATAFIGREQELNQISNLLSDPSCWLLTLLGPGGIGKTRLAVEVRRKNIANFSDGVIFIPLSMIETEQSIVPAMASALGLIFRPNGPTPDQQLLDFLSNKHLLIILDSFEQLVPWAYFLERIHSSAPGLKLLVTSRHRLLLQGEWLMEVKGLNYPQDQPEINEAVSEDGFLRYSALELFQHAVHRNRVSFQASAEDLSAIIHIARMLEGMPLGLELAATWINTLSCQEIATEISGGLDILEIPLANSSERQRSMRAVFDHSWKLLSSREQLIFPRLAIFRGSFSRQASEQVAGVTLRDLSGLVDKSLVRRAAGGKYDLHDLLRQYNAEILERRTVDNLETCRRHCAFYTTKLEDWNEQLSGTNQGQVLGDMHMDLENCKAAWEWAVCQRQQVQLEQAMDGLGMFNLRKALLVEGWETFRKANAALLDNLRDEGSLQSTRLAARLLIWQAVFSLNLEHFEEANQLLQKAQHILDCSQFDPIDLVHVRIFGLVILSWSANFQHNPEAMVNYSQQAFELSKKLKGKAPIFFAFGWGFLMSGSVSKELYMTIEMFFDDVKQAGNPFELGCVLFVLGMAELFHTYRIEKAEPLLRESINNFQLVNDPSTQELVLKTLSYLLLVQGKFAECLSVKLRELVLIQKIGDPRLIGIVHAEIGEILCHQGNYSEAEDEIRKGMALVKDRSEAEYVFRLRFLGDVLLAQGKFDQAREAYETSYHYFQSVDEKGWLFVSLTGLSRSEFAVGDRLNAWMHAKLALQLYCEIQLYSFFVYLTLSNFALLLIDHGEIVKGLELYHLTTRQGYLAQSHWFAALFGIFFEDASARLTVDERNRAEEESLGLDLSAAIELVQEFLSSV